MPKEPHREHVPITLYVERIEFDPSVDIDDFAPVLTAYNLEITEQNLRLLYEKIGKHLESEKGTKMIRVYGRRISQ